MAKPYKDYQAFLIESLKDPAEAAAYLTAALEEKDDAALLLALRNVAEARGMARLAAKTKLNRENLYRMLSRKGNPRLSSFTALLNALNLKLAIQPAKS
jgi:probable addiction module antidote protein